MHQKPKSCVPRKGTKLAHLKLPMFIVFWLISIGRLASVAEADDLPPIAEANGLPIAEANGLPIADQSKLAEVIASSADEADKALNVQDYGDKYYERMHYLDRLEELSLKTYLDYEVPVVMLLTPLVLMALIMVVIRKGPGWIARYMEGPRQKSSKAKY